MNLEKASKKAEYFINCAFPNCSAALLSGSIVKGNANETSDLDIVIFDETVTKSYRQATLIDNTPVDFYVHNFQSYKKVFEKDVVVAMPAMPSRILEGYIIKNHSKLSEIKLEAKNVLNKGPKSWSLETQIIKTFELEELLDDFQGAKSRDIEIFSINKLVELLCEFILRMNNQWIGEAKWLYKSLQNYDSKLAANVVTCVNDYYINSNKKKISDLVREILNKYKPEEYESQEIKYQY
ncbi:nucleotidyltransferase domain-containing protein [Terribacillus saccharophilus]|uniref:nucleotidyltransferase domain-containing protein n=1 Tax=Terribacillus saccharophilus TaxID=361277 RepID=UPI0038098722